jgi:hypothetical protein
VSLQRRALRGCVNLTDFDFWLNITLTLVFNFKVLLSYRAIYVFLVQKFNYPVATHEFEPSTHIKKMSRFHVC